MFVQGALGGQIGSLRGTHPPGPDGTPVTQRRSRDGAGDRHATPRRARSPRSRDRGESVSDLPLAPQDRDVQRADRQHVLPRRVPHRLLGPHPLVGYNPDEPIDEGNLPWLPLRATYLQIGPLGLVTAPGELHPELWVGGYDGSWTLGLAAATTRRSRTCRDFDEAPQPPYMRDLVLAHDGVRYPVVAGLAEDYIGYIVPAYNYVLDAADPYIVEAEGDHYEEVYSLGPLVEQHAVHPILELLRYRR